MTAGRYYFLHSLCLFHSSPPVPFLPIPAPRPHLTATSAVKCLWNVRPSNAISWFTVCNCWEDQDPLNNQVPSVAEMTILVHLSLYQHIFSGLMSPACTGGDIELQRKFKGKRQCSRSPVTSELKPADTATQFNSAWLLRKRFLVSG